MFSFVHSINKTKNSEDFDQGVPIGQNSEEFETLRYIQSLEFIFEV